jgi:hypothetical protein
LKHDSVDYLSFKKQLLISNYFRASLNQGATKICTFLNLKMGPGATAAHGGLVDLGPDEADGRKDEGAVRNDQQEGLILKLKTVLGWQRQIHFFIFCCQSFPNQLPDS